VFNLSPLIDVARQLGTPALWLLFVGLVVILTLREIQRWRRSNLQEASMRAKVLEEITKLDVSGEERERLRRALLAKLKSPEEIEQERLRKRRALARDFPKTNIVFNLLSAVGFLAAVWLLIKVNISILGANNIQISTNQIWVAFTLGAILTSWVTAATGILSKIPENMVYPGLLLWYIALLAIIDVLVIRLGWSFPSSL
jgi:hypothetical protein